MLRSDEETILKNYEFAKEVYAAYGVDVASVIETFQKVPIGIHNWEGNDVKGFEEGNDAHSENVVTGGYPGISRNGEEMRQDIEQAMKFSPCTHKLNLQSFYAEPDRPKERNEYDTEDYRKWIDWAKKMGIGMDFNVSYFTSPRMKDGNSLTSPDEETRKYWIKAGKNSRKICEDIGRELGKPCINNLWIPDGTKDMTADRMGYRDRLRDSLDQIFADSVDTRYTHDVLEGKVFSIGYECFTAGSHDFYIAYAVKHHLGITFDTGHFHPNEKYFDKISAVYPYVDYIMMHLSRGVHWDSDHCLIQDDGLRNTFLELKRAGIIDKNVGLGLDYFDGTINRVSEWIIGLRAAGKELLYALLEPTDLIRKAEYEGNGAKALALLDECNNLPINAVWDYLCLKKNAGVGTDWLSQMDRYENEVQLKRI